MEDTNAYEIIGDYDGSNKTTSNDSLFPSLVNTTHSERIIEELHPENVRWFYRSTASSHKSSFSTFSCYDSLRLETKFRELSAFKGEDVADSEKEKIIVKDCLFEADVRLRTCRPIYWTDVHDEYDIYRGTWFMENTHEPLLEQLADAVETQHLMNFHLLSYEDVRNSKKTQVLHSMEYGSYVIKWYDLDQVYLFNTKSVSYILRKLVPDNGRKIYRGFKIRANINDRPIEISHLCFVVHGIGQKFRGRIHRQCYKLKKTCKRILQQCYATSCRQDFRIEFLPIEWRNTLNLDGGIIDSITLQQFKGLRTIINNTFMDVLYYSSSMYRIEITNGLETELTRIYSMFCARNPYFESKGGKVSLVAHSLGSVICYDILRSWITLDLNVDYVFPGDAKHYESEELKMKLKNLETARSESRRIEDNIMDFLCSHNVKVPAVGFKPANFPQNFKTGSIWKRIKQIDNFFMLGSPLPVFLALRGIKPNGKIDHSDILPTNICKRIFNIYYPSDPIAYRLEPLVIHDYIKIPAMHIHKVFSGSFSSTTEDKETQSSWSDDDEDTSTISAKSFDNNRSVRFNSIVEEYTLPLYEEEDRNTPTLQKNRIYSSRRNSILSAIDELEMKLQNLKKYSIFERASLFLKIMRGDDTKADENVIADIPEIEITDIILRHRIDYTLGTEGRIRSFLSLFTSHTGYWKDSDLAKFIIDQIMFPTKSG